MSSEFFHGVNEIQRPRMRRHGKSSKRKSVTFEDQLPRGRDPSVRWKGGDDSGSGSVLEAADEGTFPVGDPVDVDAPRHPSSDIGSLLQQPRPAGIGRSVSSIPANTEGPRAGDDNPLARNAVSLPARPDPLSRVNDDDDVEMLLHRKKPAALGRSVSSTPATRTGTLDAPGPVRTAVSMSGPYPARTSSLTNHVSDLLERDPSASAEQAADVILTTATSLASGIGTDPEAPASEDDLIEEAQTLLGSRSSDPLGDLLRAKSARASADAANGGEPDVMAESLAKIRAHWGDQTPVRPDDLSSKMSDADALLKQVGSQLKGNASLDDTTAAIREATGDDIGLLNAMAIRHLQQSLSADGLPSYTQYDPSHPTTAHSHAPSGEPSTALSGSPSSAETLASFVSQKVAEEAPADAEKAADIVLNAAQSVATEQPSTRSLEDYVNEVTVLQEPFSDDPLTDLGLAVGRQDEGTIEGTIATELSRYHSELQASNPSPGTAPTTSIDAEQAASALETVESKLTGRGGLENARSVIEVVVRGDTELAKSMLKLVLSDAIERPDPGAIGLVDGEPGAPSPGSSSAAVDDTGFVVNGYEYEVSSKSFGDRYEWSIEKRGATERPNTPMFALGDADRVYVDEFVAFERAGRNACQSASGTFSGHWNAKAVISHVLLTPKGTPFDSFMQQTAGTVNSNACVHGSSVVVPISKSRFGKVQEYATYTGLEGTGGREFKRHETSGPIPDTCVPANPGPGPFPRFRFTGPAPAYATLRGGSWSRRARSVNDPALDGGTRYGRFFWPTPS